MPAGTAWQSDSDLFSGLGSANDMPARICDSQGLRNFIRDWATLAMQQPSRQMSLAVHVLDINNYLLEPSDMRSHHMLRLGYAAAAWHTSLCMLSSVQVISKDCCVGASLPEHGQPVLGNSPRQHPSILFNRAILCLSDFPSSAGSSGGFMGCPLGSEWYRNGGREPLEDRANHIG